MAKCVILSGGTWSPDNRPRIKRYLGPYRLATALESSGYSTFVLDYIEHFTKEELAQVLSLHINEETLWVGFSSSFFWNGNSDADIESMYYSKYQDVKYLFNFIRFISPNVKFIYGGSKSQYFAIDDVDSNIDYYVTGNADNSIISLTKDIDAGIKRDKIVDSLKYEEPKMIELKTDWGNHPVIRNEGLPLELARGCIFKCKFCDYPLTGKKKGTYLRDPNQIKDEMIKNWEDHGTESYFFTDDTFNDDNDKLESLHKVFSDLPFDLKFSSFLRLDLINRFPHQATLLKDMGLVGNFFGIESLQQQSATAVGKGLRTSKVKDRLYWLKEKWGNTVNIEAGFILGLPYDTREYFEELIKWCMEKDNPIDAAHFYPLMLFRYKQDSQLKRYASEFDLNSDIYGYTGKNNWELPSQGLNYDICSDYSKRFNNYRAALNKIAGFGVITALNTGVMLEDIRTLTEIEIENKYNIPSMNNVKIREYKRMIGL